MIYNTEAILSVEIAMESARVSAYTPKGNDTARVEELDLVKEERMQTFYQME